MTIEVTLNSEMEARLLAEAKAQGVPLEKAAERLLALALASASGPQGALTIAEFRVLLKDLAEGSAQLPDLPTETFTRESFYQDRS